MKNKAPIDFVICAAFLAYFISAFAGACYLVESHGWSAWWILLPAVFMGLNIKEWR